MTRNRWVDIGEDDSVATKRELWEPISERVGGFDVDPASGCEPTPIADTRYTEEDNGLSKPWFGTVWLNPPFSNKERWYKQLVGKYTDGSIERAVALAPCDTSAGWFHQWFSQADVICFLDGRDWYMCGGSPAFATQVGVWNPTDAVVSWLNQNGTVVEPKHDNGQTTL